MARSLKPPRSIYLESGYLDIRSIKQSGYPFIFIIGARGTGKTFGALTDAILNKEKFAFMRRTQSQVDLIRDAEFSPFNKDMDKVIGFHADAFPINKYSSGIYETYIDDDGRMRHTGEQLGFTCALSTISNMRGFDASKVSTIIYDEFIPEKHERPIRAEGSAFLNAYETINRNREFNGGEPVQCICLANSNNIGNPIFLELRIISLADKAKSRKSSIATDDKRGILLISLDNSPISQRKRNTALYRLAVDGTDFKEMALANDYNADLSETKSKNLTEYKPLVVLGELAIYEHKTGTHLYVTTHKSGTPREYEITDLGLRRFFMSNFWIYQEYLRDNVIFETKYCEALFQTLMKGK